MLKACEKAAKFYNLQLKTANDASKANTTLQSRGITEDVIQKFTLGWAPDKFDVLYKEMLDFYKDTDKTLVIDSAQFRNIKEISLLKGKVIVIRTCINTCYERCIDRYKKNYPDASLDEIEKYANKKKSIYKWYKFSNNFINKVDSISKSLSK
jgi:hypothetical protein